MKFLIVALMGVTFVTGAYATDVAALDVSIAAVRAACNGWSG